MPTSSPEKRISQTYDPIENLPFDVWLEIMLLAISQSSVGPLPYLAISLQWKRSMLDSSELWSTIVLDGGEDEAARISTFLHLSGNQFLSVVYIGTKDMAILSMLLDHSSRIRSFHHSLPGFSTDSKFDIAEILLSCNRPYPNMEVISGTTWNLYHQFPARLLAACPTLESIVSFKLPMDYEPFLSRHIRQVQLETNHEGNIQGLLNRSSLRDLTIVYSRHSLHQVESSNDQASVTATQMHNLTQCLGDHLRNLKLALSSRMLAAFIGLLPLFRKLVSLSLVVEIMPHHPGSIKFADCTRLNIRDFALEFLAGRRETAALAVVATAIISAFTHRAPFQGLDTLHFTSFMVNIKLTDLLTFLNSTPNVKELMIRIPHLADSSKYQEASEIAMKKLSFLLLDPPTLLNHIFASSVLDLQLYERGEQYPTISPLVYSTVSKLVTSSLVLDNIQCKTSIAHPVAWPSLVYLKLFSGQGTKHLHLLPALRTLVISSRDQFKGEGRQAINLILVKLLLDPNLLPNLTTIGVDGYPSWDLLFEVLRRRNSQGRTRIKQLTLPNLPIESILSPLVHLLGGETDARTRMVIDRIILRRFSLQHRCIHACTFCIEAGYIHCLGQVTAHRRDDLKSQKQVEALEEVLSLEAPVLAGFQETASGWALFGHDSNEEILANLLKISERTGSTSICRAHLKDVSVDITEHTLNGACMVSQSVRVSSILGTTTPPWFY